MLCPKCGSKLYDGALYCGNCGAKLDKPVDNADKDTSKNPLYLVTGIIACCLLILFSIALYTYHKSGDENSDSVKKEKTENSAKKEEGSDSVIEKIQEELPASQTGSDQTENESNNEDNVEIYQYRCIKDAVNIRTEPSVNSSVIGKAAKGDVLTGTGAVSEDGAWVEILLENNVRGWTAAEYYETVGNIPAETSSPDPVENTDQNVSPITFGTSSCYRGRVKFSCVDYNISSSTITIRIDNGTDQEVRTFGLPSLIVNGETISINPYSNMSEHMVSIMPGSYKDITYLVDNSVFVSGGRLTGSMWIMDPLAQDNMYSINITVNEPVA